MNLNLTKDEFHETMMLYIIHVAKENQAVLAEGDTIVFSPEFDEFLRHVNSRPLGDLRTVYFREDAKTKLAFKRTVKNLEEKDNVRLII